MRLFWLASLALIFQSSFSLPAQAKGIPIIYGTEDSLDLIEATEIPGPDGNPLSLCSYTTKYHLFYLGFWRTSHGYVLTDNGCSGDSYYEFTDADLSEAQKLGMIRSDLPPKPKMSMNQIASGFGGLGIVALIVLFLILKSIGSSRRKAKRRAEMGDIQKEAGQILDAMCHAAISDGTVDDSEITTIADIAQQMTGETIDPERIRSIISKASKKPSDNEFKAFGAGMAPEQKTLLLKAVFAVIWADGQITESEHAFFIKTAQALSLDAETVRQVIAEVQNTDNTQT